MSHNRSDVVELLRNYDVFLRHVGYFPEFNKIDLAVNRRKFVGFEEVTRLSDKELYVVAAKCIVAHRWVSNSLLIVDADLIAEVIAKAKDLVPTVENQVNAWLATYTTNTLPNRWFDAEGVSNWHGAGTIGTHFIWNFSA